MPDKKTSPKKLAYDKQYYHDYVVRKVLNFNMLIPEDAELLEWLESQSNRTQYIKQLIRKDMERNKDSNPV